MAFFQQAVDPPTPLGRYRNLSKLAGVLVSPIALGGASIGTKWYEKFGRPASKDASFKLLDTYYDAGGNFIDTANSDQDGDSEEYIGEWMEKRGIRDQIVLATKFSLDAKAGDASIPPHAHINYTGNNAKSLFISVRDSLKRLRSEYIDILYVHWWGFDTSIPEIMSNLHDLVAAKKVLYLGVSNAPAWVVSQANQWALDHGKTPFAVYQGAWNVLDRSFERDIIPMARLWGMALAPYNVIAGGKLRTDAEEARRKETGERGRDLFGTGWERNEAEKKMSHALEQVAAEVGVDSIAAVAVAYVMQKTTYVFPIVGGSKIEQLKDNIKALDISLTQDQISRIESAGEYNPGFPHDLIGNGTSPVMFMTTVAKIDHVRPEEPIRPVSTTFSPSLFKMLPASVVLLAALASVQANPVAKRQFAGQHTGDATNYDVGLGACGIFNVPSDFIVAVGHDFFDNYPGYTGGNPNNNPICGLTATASYQGKTISVQITDRCEACAMYDLDFSNGAFEALIGPISIGRVHGMTWSIDSLSGPPPPTGGCSQFYTAVAGDTCDAIDRKFGITLQTFLSLNPNVNAQCTNLQVGTQYCVAGGGSTPPPSGGCPHGHYTAVTRAMRSMPSSASLSASSSRRTLASTRNAPISRSAPRTVSNI
ncbi:Aldo/keto reductase [Auricularia subglabra TFB-10046 SS5]|nr:Aldo/keto reductase [Auricularia subglabra TFB-10046 SS5]